MQLARFIFIILILHSADITAQNEVFSRLGKSEDSISAVFNKAISATSNTDKSLYNDSVFKMLNRILKTEKSFDYPFDSLKKIGKSYSPDRSFRIFNWNMPLTDGTYEYKGFIQAYYPKNNQLRVFELTDRSEQVAKPENSVLSAGKWFGALYYKLLKNEADNRTYYTMLGLRYQNLFLSRKVIEVLYFDEWGNPVFGAPIFQVDNKIKHRIVFNYSARVGMSLKYSDELKMIVCDHLAPSESIYKGQYEYYGPDFSFDGYEFVKGKWIQRTDLNIKNPNPSRPPRINHPPDSSHKSTTQGR
jgi:hypothetical protein